MTGDSSKHLTILSKAEFHLNPDLAGEHNGGVGEIED